MSLRHRHIVALGDHDVWAPPLTGSLLRSERIAVGLARHYRVTYACTGDSSVDEDLRRQWAENAGIAGVVMGTSNKLKTSARWGGPFDALRSLWPVSVPLDVREFVSLDLVARLKQLHHRDRIDAVWAQRSWMAETARRAGLPNVICDIGDFQHAFLGQATDRMAPYRREQLHRFLNARLREYEFNQPMRFVRVTVTKAEDLTLLDASNPDRVSVVPNGFDLPPKAIPQGGQGPSCLFVGMLEYWPNIDAVQWFLKEIFPAICAAIPECRLVVAGRGPVPPELNELVRQRNVDLLVSPESLGPCYANASVVVAPIRYGHGTKIKALEALAHSRPLVATTEAVRGHPILNGQQALVADSADAFASACLALLQDPERARHLAENGRSLAERIGGWNQSVACAKQVIDDLLLG